MPVAFWAVLIFLCVLGPAVGNYACSVIYRLPRGHTPFERQPYCGHCQAALKPIDLFPILSWLSTRGKCRYCAGPIPALYTVVEVTCLAMFVLYFLDYSISETFLLYTAYGVFVVILAGIHWQQGWIAATIYSYALGLLILARTLLEGSIYGPIKGGVVMLVIMLLFWKIGQWTAKTKSTQTPFEKPWIWWFVLLGALVPFSHWHWLAAIYVLKLCVPKRLRVIVYAASALGLPIFLV